MAKISVYEKREHLKAAAGLYLRYISNGQKAKGVFQAIMKDIDAAHPEVSPARQTQEGLF